ncbi:MAG: hypothetical protein PF637_06630 [Spirochaetes bacterium]|jgi:hypothetical protein|nr:hypothetical protein [Spirochaetota bacterium]
MIRMEIIANQSVQEEIVESIETMIPDFYYTIVPLVHGRGEQGRRLESTTWPETNFMMIAYIEDKVQSVIKKSVSEIKSKFGDEGIKLFFIKAIS